MRQMRHYMRGIETVSHFAYFDSFVGLFMQKWRKSHCLTFSRRFERKSYQLQPAWTPHNRCGIPCVVWRKRYQRRWCRHAQNTNRKKRSLRRRFVTAFTLENRPSPKSDKFYRSTRRSRRCFNSPSVRGSTSPKSDARAIRPSRPGKDPSTMNSLPTFGNANSAAFSRGHRIG